MGSMARSAGANIRSVANGVAGGGSGGQHAIRDLCGFQMPLHYPRYTKVDYENMPEWKLDCLLAEYGLPAAGDVIHKRKFAMGAFLWRY